MRISLNWIQLQFTTRSKQTGQLQIDRVAFQLTQRIHIYTCSHAFQLCAISAAFMWLYLVKLLLQDLFGHLQVLQSHPQLLVLLLQATPLLLYAVQLAVKTDRHVLRHLRGQEDIGLRPLRSLYVIISH